MEKIVTIDFETFSECELKKSGAWMYSRHPSTEILCMVYIIDGKVHLYKPGDDIDPLICALAMGYRFEAHNVFFERCIWLNVAVPKLGWPNIPEHLWRCSMAKCSALSLPRALGDVGRALRLAVVKDEEGKRVMMKLSKPRKPTKNDPTTRYTPENSFEDFKILYNYCIDDGRSEVEIGKSTKDLSPKELIVWQLDQTINLRGIHIDREAVESALYLADKISDRLNSEARKIVNGYFDKVSQRQKVLDWCLTQGFEFSGLTERDLTEILDRDDLTPKVRRIIEIRDILRKTSTTKLKSFLDRADTDDRIRGNLLYHGAGTGRWAGMGIQPQNLPRPMIKDIDICIELIKERNLGLFMAIYGSNSMTAISSCIRGMINAAPGNDLICGDFSAIEARVLVWLAGIDWAVKMFYNKVDTYVDLAAEVYNRPASSIGKKSIERDVGKRGILGLGYGMGKEKFKQTCYQLFNIVLDDTLAQRVVDTYRAKYYEVVSFWYAIENSAISTVKTGQVSQVGKIFFGLKDGYLKVRLPSGRCISYYKPAIIMGKTPWGEPKEQLTFMGVDSMTRKWIRQKTYGGKLVENIVQGTAADFMRESMVRVERAGYPVILTVHDENLCEIPKDFGSIEEFEKIMAHVPSWGRGCPIDVEAWRGERYRK